MRTTKVILVDDLDGTEGDSVQTVNFSVDGRDFEIDLAPASMERFDEALKPFVDAARAVKKKRGKRAAV